MLNYLENWIRVFPPFNNYIRNRRLQQHFRNELALINGIDTSTSRHPSIIHFSVNKAATQYIKSILKTCSTANGLVPIGIHDYAVRSDFPYLDKLSAVEMQKYRHIFISKGYLYSVFGGMISGIRSISKFKIILVVRDPRDILVSQYFSMAYSHQIPDSAGNKRESFLNKRNEARGSNIDEYVLKKCDDLLKIFSRYNTELLTQGTDIFITKYETMLKDFNTWLNRLLDYSELTIDPKLATAILHEHEKTKPQKEDSSKHLRKGLAGDYKTKLKAETICELNDKFSYILDKFNYEQN